MIGSVHFCFFFGGGGKGRLRATYVQYCLIFSKYIYDSCSAIKTVNFIRRDKLNLPKILFDINHFIFTIKCMLYL